MANINPWEKYGCVIVNENPKLDNDWIVVFTREKNGKPDKKSNKNAIKRLKKLNVSKICFCAKTWGLFFVTKEGKITCEQRPLLIRDDVLCVKEISTKLTQRCDELFGTHRECDKDGVVYFVWDVK